jgi:multidrug transporter EmrE-like cation transporter
MSALRGFTWVALSLACQLLSMVYGKMAAMTVGHATPLVVARNPHYLACLGFLALQALFWPQVLRHFPLFRAYLFMGLVYVAIPLVSRFVFGEPLSTANLLGSALIAGGVGLLARTGNQAAHA